MRQSENEGLYVSGGRESRDGAKGLLGFLLGTVVFGVAYTQPALYYSNQNQYFLHGLAHGGFGFLDQDWLARTADPTPVFSVLVAFTYRYLHEWFFYIYYLFILGVYLHALAGLFTALSGGRPTACARLGFVTLLVALHSGLVRWASAQLFGVDYPWYFQAGVANQYVLGAGLQPSVFGVLLLLSVSAFLRDRPLSAATWSSLAAVMHSTYLLTATLLTLSYLFLLCREKRVRAALLVGAWALLLVAPVLVYNLLTFAPSSAEEFAKAQYLLAHVRIPHHALVERWLDGIACAQLGWVLLAMYLVRGRRLFVILGMTFTLSLLLTLVQLGTGNDTLALLFPWRSSAILVPLATAVVLTRVVNRVADWFPSPSLSRQRPTAFVCGVVLAIMTVGGASINYLGLGYRTNSQELKLLGYIWEHKRSGEVYLLPVEVPTLTAGKRGAASLNFTPPPRRATQTQVISVDLQRFRLFTGAPIYVDFKSIPYKDVEVLEWDERVRWNHALYKQRDWDWEEIKTELDRRRITHVIATADRDLRCEALEQVYSDQFYRLYRVRSE
ncbi:MAG TPA: DUF6798 domain-containing protein [Gemmataceae bacterium]|jgi:hypothetical protein